MFDSSQAVFPPVPPRCAHCGDVIGVYEPLVAIVDDGLVRETSRAAEPHLVLTARDAMYHSVCYELVNLG